MATTNPDGKLLPLHNLANVNTVIGMLYDENGVYRAAFEPEVFYNTILLDTLKYGDENYVHLKYAEILNIRKGNTTAKFRRWAGMTPTLTPLKEGIPPAPDKHAYETIEIGNVFSFGRWSEYTDRVNLSVVNELLAERSLQYGEVANQTKELYARKTWLSSPNEFFANFKDFGTLGFGDAILLDDLRFLIARMKRMQVKPINNKFNYICSPEFINGLIDDPRVKAYMSINHTTGNLWTTGEPFPLFELEFIPTMLDEFAYPDTEFPGVYELPDGKEVIRLYALGTTAYNADTKTLDTPIYYLNVHQDYVVGGTTKAKQVLTNQYLKDGTAVEELIKWELPLNMDYNGESAGTGAFTSWAAATTEPVAAEVPGIASSLTDDPTDKKVIALKSIRSRAADGTTTHGPVTAIAANDLATEIGVINSLIADGAFMQLPIHRGILFGAEAMLKLNVEGISDSPQIIVKELGSSGVADPINQRQSIGFKVDGFGLAIKRPEALCVTYGIPQFAEMAALTSATLTGDWTLMDGRMLDDDYANHIANSGEQALRVDGVNKGGFPGDPNVNGATADLPIFSASVAYAAGDIVIYNGRLYVFTQDHSAGAWNAAHVKLYKKANTLEKNPLDVVNDKKSNTK